ncbi:MAG: hypothetical protein J5819_00945 [Eubacterium sp.]|nr:hypothetical protein [Eubacterium sp.]
MMEDSLQYQVYEVTYERSFQTRKKILESGLSKQDARDLARKHRSLLDPTCVVSKGFGFEEMDIM